MTQRVVLIRHGGDPADDRVATFCRDQGFQLDFRRPYKGDTLGDPDETVAASILYGGPFNVFETDRHRFLIDEHRWAEQCMAGDIPLLGICQGAQSIAHVLGAAVGPRPGEPYEFGYYPIYATDAGKAILPDRLHVTQAHFHQFEIPQGADLLAYSDLFAHQAFRYGERTFGFQFHPEVTREGFRRWQEEDWAGYGKPGAQTREQQDTLAGEHDPAQHRWFMGFLNEFLGQR